MNETVKKEILDVLTMLGMISLHGDALDVMAAAKSKLRKSLTLLEEAGADG